MSLQCRTAHLRRRAGKAAAASIVLGPGEGARPWRFRRGSQCSEEIGQAGAEKRERRDSEPSRFLRVGRRRHGRDIENVAGDAAPHPGSRILRQQDAETGDDLAEASPEAATRFGECPLGRALGQRNAGFSEGSALTASHIGEVGAGDRVIEEAVIVQLGVEM